MKRNNFIEMITVCNLIFLFGFVHSQTLDLKVIKAGKLIDVETAKVLFNQIILIENDTIRAIGPDIHIPENAIFYDLTEFTVLPGLIDCHTHLSWQSENYYDDLFRKSIIDNAIMASTYAKRVLEAGFTSCRDVGSIGFINVALRNAITNGDIVGPRLQVAGIPISCTGGHGDLIGFSPWLDSKFTPEMLGIADGIEGVRKEVRFNIKNGANIIKFYASSGVLDEAENVATPQYSQEEMNAIVDEASTWGRKVCAHAMGPASIKMAIKAGVASIEHGCIMDDECFKLMKERNTYLVSDIYVDDFIINEYAKKGFPILTIEKEKEVGLIQRQFFKKAVAADILIAFGTDAGVYPHGWNARQFKYMVEWGMTPMQAIRSATLNASKLLGWENKVGSIKKGKLADIIATGENPIENISSLENVMFVMKGGIVYKNITK